MKKKVMALFASLAFVAGISICNVSEAQLQWRQPVLERPVQVESSLPTIVEPDPLASPREYRPAPPPREYRPAPPPPREYRPAPPPPREYRPAPPPPAPRYNYYPNYYGGYYGGGYGGYRPHISVYAGRGGGGFGISGPGYNFHFSF